MATRSLRRLVAVAALALVAGCGEDERAASDPSPVVLAACEQRFADLVVPARERPSSGRACSNDSFCLPWERCFRGRIGGVQELSPPRCLRPCDDMACAGGGACNTLLVDDGDVSFEEHVCLGAAADRVVPSYPQGAEGEAAPAEGGLGCWTPLVDTLGENGGSQVTVVGSFLYMLFSGGVAGDRLEGVRLATPAPPDALFEVALPTAPEAVTWSRVHTSGDRLLAFRRPAFDGRADPEADVPTTVLWGIPDARGDVTLADAGVSFTLPGDRGALVPGSRSGCLVVADGARLDLLCFPIVDERLTSTRTALEAPAEVGAYLTTYRQQFAGPAIQQRPWTLAVSDRHLVIVHGHACDASATGPRLLHVAPFDPATNLVAGSWTTVPLDGLFRPCTSNQMLLVHGDTVYLDGLTARLDASTPEWLVATQRAPADGFTLTHTIAGDVIVALNLITLSGAAPPARVLVDRLVW